MTTTTGIASKVSPAALALMLTVVFLSLFDAGFDNNAVHWVLFMLLAMTMFLAYRGRLPLDLDLKQPLLWYAFFLLWAGVSIFWSINPHRTLVEFLQLTAYGLAFLLASSLDEDNIFRVGRIALVTGFGIALFGLSQYLLLDSSRIHSTLDNANSLGIYLVMLFLFGWAYYLRRPHRYLPVVAVTLLVALVLTGSRGSFICLALALPLLLLGLQRVEIKTALLKTAFCLALALLLVQGVMFIAPYLQEAAGESTALTRVITTRSSFVSWSGVSRFAFWETGLRIAMNEPLTGTGLGTFFLAYFTEYVDNIFYSRFVHNHYIQTLAELGLVGAVLLVGFIITIGRRVWNRLKQNECPLFLPGLIAAAVAFLIHIGGDFSWNFPGSAVIFFIISGALVSMTRTESVGRKKNLNSGLILISLLLFALTAWQLSANLTYRQGLTHDVRGDYLAAANIYDRANSFYPINSMAYSFAANSYYRLARQHDDRVLLEEAIKRSERAVQLSPVDGNLHNQLGRLYWQAGQMEQAEKHLKLAVDYAAYRLGMFIDLSRFYIQQERYAEAEKIIDRGLELKDYAEGMHPSEEDRQKVENQIQVLKDLSDSLQDI